MAEEPKPQITEPINPTDLEAPKDDMELEAPITAAGETDADAAANGGKRQREEGDGAEEGENGVEKKQKVDEKSMEEQRLEELEKSEGGDNEKGTVKEGPVSVGFKTFGTSVEMFDYFYGFLHSWSINVDINKYEHAMLLDLLQKGHQEPERKIGDGVHAFQIRFHPKFKSRCFFVIRKDETVDDFSFRKCVDNILPLPENMQIKADVNKTFGGRNGGGRGGGRGGGGWRGRGRGRGGKPRN